MSKLTHELPDRFSNPNAKNRYWIVKSLEQVLDEQSQDIGDAKNQYFFSTSSGVYLLRLATRYGMDFENSDIYTPNLLRSVAPIVAYQPQCTRSTMWKTLEAFYTPSYTHTVLIGVSGNFDLQDKDFVIEVDGERESIVFSSDRFDDINSVTVDEVIQLYNQSMKLSKMYKVKTPNGEKLALKSSKVGYSRVKIISGTANTEFLFTDVVKPLSPSISVVKQLSPKTVIQWSSIEDSLFYQLSVGDFLTIKSGILDGGFEVVEIEDDKITILSDIPEGTYSVTPSDFFFVLNKEYNLYDNDLYAAIDEASVYNNVFFTLPAIAPIHSESFTTTWYGWNTTYDVTDFDRGGVFISGSIKIGSVNFVLENPNIAFDSSNITQGLGNVDGYVRCTMPYTSYTKINNSKTPFYVHSNEIIVQCDHEHRLHTGVEVDFQGDFTGSYTVKRVVDKKTFSFTYDAEEESVTTHSVRSTSEYGLLVIMCYSASDARKFLVGNNVYIEELKLHTVVSATSETQIFLRCDYPPTNKQIGTNVTLIKTLNINSQNIEYKVDPSQSFYDRLKIVLFQGLSYYPSYVYDTNPEFTTLSQYGSLLDSVYANTQAHLKISSQYTLQPSGSVVIEFATNRQEVLKYSSIVKIATNTWLIHVDPNQLLDYDHKKGSVVRVVTDADIWKYRMPYIVSTADKRKECVRILEQVAAAGVEVTPDVVYPDIKNEDISSEIYR